MSDVFDGFPLRPRAGGVLLVLVIARISTVHQDARSLADQIALCEKYVRDRYPGPVEFVHIQSQGSGEILDRAELAQAEADVESGRFDLVILEDIGRLCRRSRAVDFCELCEDAGTRLVAVNDAIDTAAENWRLNAFFASFKHESGNKDTSKRIRRSLRNRFLHGEVVQTFPYGYDKPLGARTDADVSKDPAAEAVYEAWFAMLEAGASYAEVADYLNATAVPPGRWARNRAWDGRMVMRVTHNPILKGYRRRNERVSRRVNKTGRRRAVKAPEGERLTRHVPHLAFVDPARYDRLIAALASRHGGCARGRRAGSPDARAGVPKKRTVWPGQHLACGVCGRPFYWGGHGQADHMMCAGARDYACWNGATLDGHSTGRRVAAAVLAAAEELPEFDAAFRDKVEAAAATWRAGRDEAGRRLAREAGEADRELANVVDALARVGYSAALRARLAEVEARVARLAAERADLDRQPDDVPVLLPADELRARARAAVGRLQFADPTFGRLMSALVPRLVVFPYQARDGGAVVLRAHAVVNLAPLVPEAVAALGGLIARTVTIDLFDPPQRVAFRDRVVALRAAGRTEGAAAAELGLTVTAAQKAVALHRLTAAAGATDPYVRLTVPPADGGKLSRHHHPRYVFRPLEGYPVHPPDAA